MILWIKALHIVFVASWFAGLFYLPRIFVNLALETDAAATKRLLLMAQKLFRFTTIIAIPAVLLGLWLLLAGPWLRAGWMHAKLVFVLLTLGYHHACGSVLKKFMLGGNTRSHAWYRWFNEIPVLLLLAAVVLVVVKPF